MLADPPRPDIQGLPPMEATKNVSHLPSALALSKEAHARTQRDLIQSFPLFIARQAPLPTSILDALQSIAGRVTEKQYRGNVDLLKQTIFDANTLALNPPCATDDSDKVASFSIGTYQAILATILECGSIETSDLEYLHTHHYLKLKAPQRFFLLASYTLKKSVRTGFLGSDNGSRLLNHSGLAYWLTHSPYIHFRQTGLNTCIATVFAQECLNHAPTLAALHPICHNLLKRLRILSEQAETAYLKTPAWSGGPSVETLLQKRFKAIESMLSGWHRELSSALRSPASRLNFDTLAAQGHTCLETILSCASIAAPNWGEDPEALVTLNTPYMIPGRWHLSRALLGLKQGLQRLRGKNIPSLKERYHRGYVSYDGCKALLSRAIQLPATEGESYLVFPAGKRPSEEELTHLWEHTTRMGSTRLERPGHAALLRTRCQKKIRFFILDDPMEKAAQILDFKALADVFTQQEIILFVEPSKEA